MLVFYSDDLTVTGLQTFPEESEQPHIVVGDDCLDELSPGIGSVKLIQDGDDIRLPDDWLQQCAALVPDPEREAAIAAIDELESQQTPRMLRQAALGDEDSKAMLLDIENKISEQRELLKNEQ